MIGLDDGEFGVASGVGENVLLFVQRRCQRVFFAGHTMQGPRSADMNALAGLGGGRVTDGSQRTNALPKGFGGLRLRTA